ncbi:putative chaperone protein [Rhypophila decipiens]|uniref:Chaperone protein n=1 Tax=Rhypophila decipiens TaxID=261697 RepID=A0AAN6YAG0_9PEZI|nr:putative chaperone protein [Rhypophila decipiens]
MAPKVPLDWEMLEQVFGGRKDILQSIKTEADSPDRVLLFNNIATYVYNKIQTSQDEPPTKRRRVDIATISQPNGHSVTSAPNGAAGSRNDVSSGGGNAASEDVLLEIKDVSLSAPQRKKYDLCFTDNFLYARVSGTSAPVQGIVYPWKDIEHALYLPVPEKAQVQHNYVLFPRLSYLPAGKQQASDQAGDTLPALEPLVFTIPATAPKPGSILGPKAAAAAPYSDSYTTLFNWALSTSLKSAGNTTGIISSDPKVFHSALRQPVRPSEKAVHVKGFRGSKDGWLFFLPTGILWGFKKPLLFLPLERIVAISFTGVLQRTFNIVIEYEGYSAGTEEIEFSMIDQEDYGAIDANYVRRHGLADRSMAEQRKAKRELAENAKGIKTEDGEEGGEGHQTVGGDEDARMNGMTELEKAQFMEELRLQDEEDEDEEDYDPGSDGESEGSGSSSGDDDEDDDDDEDGEGGEEDDDEGPGEDGDEEMAG